MEGSGDKDGSAMKVRHWKKQTARNKALWPAGGKGYLRPQHTVTVSLDAELAEWVVEHIVGRSSYTCDLEETIETALRMVRCDADGGT
jgi:hypothetical protein